VLPKELTANIRKYSRHASVLDGQSDQASTVAVVGGSSVVAATLS